ncbi:MAG: 3'-5' exoribonuclease, partial [Gammaproteobacteria bacterium]|nr:3'-5' exoribonuclease [Gammaproteobacteria bacterium]
MGAAEDPSLPRELAFVDLETTGGNAAYHRITEVGVVRMSEGRIVEEWSTLVNPECRIPAQIQAFTGISDAMVADAPRFAEIASTVAAKLDGALFVAHNARFDYSFLRAEFRRLEADFAAKVLCTVKLSRRLRPEERRHNLDAVMQRHGVVCGARHRALGDARVLADLWEVWRRDPGERRLGEALAAVLASPALPAGLPAELADELPEGPGVYRFYGEDGALLYVGKSVTLRARVLAHFAAEHRDSREQRLARQVRRVDWLETAGEIGALLTEAALVKSQKPLHNQRLRKAEGYFTMVFDDPPSGRLRIEPIEDQPRSSLANCFGLFRSPRDASKALAEIARERQLCLKTLGLEDGPG